MFCTQCGATIPDDSRFCEQCGAAVSAEAPAPRESAEQHTRKGPTYPGWTAEIDLGKIEDFTYEIVGPMLDSICEGERQFLTLTPPQLIEGSRYMQVCSDDHGALHVELCMARGSAGFEIYGLDGISTLDAAGMLGLYLKNLLPRPPAGQEWRLI